MMKKAIQITLSSAALLTITVSGFNYLTVSNIPVVTEDERVKYEKFINAHEFSQIRYTPQEIKGMPKRDRPDLAWEQDYLATMNPALGRPEREKLAPILAMTKTMQQTATPTAPGNASTPWVERGPDNVGGRTRALTWDPTTTNKVWAGSVTGGLWYNNDITSAASSWQAVNDFWDNIAVTAIAFDPNNANTIYVGTGEGWGAASSRGAGIWKSTNGGTSFAQLTSTTGFYYINDLVVRNEAGASVVYAAVAKRYYMGQWQGFDDGLQRSTNGGTSWTQELPDVGGNPEAPTDIEIAADNTIWVGVDAGPFNNGGGKIYSSTNGTTFSLKHNHGSAGRVNLACANSDANYIYAAFESNNELDAFKRSTNAGTSFTTMTEPIDADNGIPNTDFTRGQAWYDLTLDVDPNNKDVVMIGGIDLFKTTNGGAAWTQITKWSNNNNLAAMPISLVHADQHTIVYKPGSSTEIIFGNDGGVFYTSNGTNATPTIDPRIDGYNVTQYYACAIHPIASSNSFLAGSQDNGTQQYSVPGINSTTEATGGDGGYCFIDQTNAQYQFTSYVYNSWYRSTNAGAWFNSIQSDQTTGKFINPADYDDNQDVLYSAHTSSTIQRITSATGTESISNFTIAGMGAMASHLSVSPYTTTSTTLFVGTDAGRVFKITNAQSTATSTEITGASFPTGAVSCIALGASENEILVTFSNYGVSSVWYTSNGGTTWVAKEGNLPDMPVRWALFNPNDYNEVILATEVGVWTTAGLNTASPNWTTSNSGLANVRVDMLQMRTSDNEVIAATHGRGLFSSDGFNGVPPPTLVADFSASTTNTLTNTPITFTDMSTPAATGWTWSFTPNTATYQGGTTANSQHPQVSFNNPGMYSVTLTATDGTSSDTEIKTNYITITAPASAITWTTQPTNVTIDCDASSLPANTGTATATTTCGSGGLNVTHSDVTTAGSCANESIITRSWTATDNCSNTATFDQIITVQDTTDPTINCPANQAQTATNGVSTTLNDYTTMATASDNCSNNANITITQNPAAGSTQNVGTVNVVLTATDECGNTANCNFDVVITAATSAITWTAQPANTTIDCDASNLPANTGTATATTACGTGGLNVTYSDATAAGSCANESTITRSWTATDNCSNTATFDQIITVQDTTDPMINCPINQSQVAANGTSTTLNDYTMMATVFATDNCSNSANISITQNPAIGSTQNVGTVNVILTATDECGNTANCTFDVVITAATSAITWTAQPANVTIDCDASSLPANTGEATATTNCSSGGLNVTYSDFVVAGSCPSEGTITRTWTATDNCGSSQTFDQMIAIKDTTNPTISCPTNQTQMAANDTNTTLNDYTTVAVISDNCSNSANITTTQFPAIGSVHNLGKVNVLLTATDECGNTTNCNFDVMISKTVGIADNAKKDIAIFPNPTTGLLTIDLGNAVSGDITIQVYNLLGEVVYNELKENAGAVHQLNLQDVDKGIYYLSIQGNEEVIIKKIMIM